MENGYNPITEHPSDNELNQAYRDGYNQGCKDYLRILGFQNTKLTEEQRKLYNQTEKRLVRVGHKTPFAQIVALAEEIELYRAKINKLEELLDEEMRRHRETADALAALQQNSAPAEEAKK